MPFSAKTVQAEHRTECMFLAKLIYNAVTEFTGLGGRFMLSTIIMCS